MAKGKGGNIISVVENIVKPVADELGYEIWDIRYEKEGPDWFLRIFIDKDGDMTTEDCEKLSRAVDPLIDEADPVEGSYFFEVSSPGLGRKLTKPSHFDTFCGEKIEVRLYRPDENGNKEYAVLLKSTDDTGIVLETETNTVSIEYKDISSAKLCDDENLFG